jgi:acid phosphatase type 7
MPQMHRRAFFGSSLAGLTAAIAAAQDGLPVAPPPRPVVPVPTDLTPQDTLFLTWQRDPTTTMTVQWVGPAVPDAAVRYVPRLGNTWQTAKVGTRPFPKTELSVHRCELTGLTPGTEYVFQLGKAGPTHKFRTMPAKATDVIQFVSGGDCGVNAHAVNTNILAAKQEPYFALIGGDLGYDNGRSAGTAINFLRNYAKHMIDPKGRLIPMVTCIGNHEVNGGYNGKREDATFYLPLFDGLYRDTTYATLDFGDYLSLVLLDTGHIAPIGGEQADWLGEALREREERPHLFAVNHVPAYPSYRAPEGAAGRFGTGEANRLHWCPLFERYNVDVVLEHHDHTFKRTHRLKGGLRDENGILYLGDGSWGQLRTPNTPEKRPYLATVSKAYHMTVHRLEGDQRFHVALEESGRVASLPFSANSTMMFAPLAGSAGCHLPVSFRGSIFSWATALSASPASASIATAPNKALMRFPFCPALGVLPRGDVAEVARRRASPRRRGVWYSPSRKCPPQLSSRVRASRASSSPNSMKSATRLARSRATFRSASVPGTFTFSQNSARSSWMRRRAVSSPAFVRAMPTFSHITCPSSRCNSTAVFFPFTASSFLIRSCASASHRLNSAWSVGVTPASARRASWSSACTAGRSSRRPAPASARWPRGGWPRGRRSWPRRARTARAMLLISS